MTSRSLSVGALLVLIGCSHTVVVSQPMVEMDRARGAAAVQEAATLAPQAREHAEEERTLAKAAEARGDMVAAELYAERATVAYEHAVVLARLARAVDEKAAATAAVGRRGEETLQLSTSRGEFDHQADALAAEIALVRASSERARIAPADPARERARLVAARSLAAEGELLCGAASLLVARPSNGPPVAEDVARVEAAARGVAALAGTLDHAGGRAAADLDAAASSRAACLDALTHVRRAAGGAIAGDADALLSELSARGGWAPSRDERGVVVTLRDAWKGVGLTADAERQLKELGRVAGVHPAFLLQVVVHDGAPPGPSERAADSQRAQAALAVLTSSGAAQLSRALTLGAALPVTDPGDPGARARNARLEVVFVSPAE